MRTFVRNRALVLATIVALALVLRVGYAIAFDRFGAEPEWDAVMYCKAAHNILAGNGYSYDGVRPTTFWAPLYPYFLAGVFGIFGENIVAAQCVQIVIDCATILLIYVLGAKVFNRRVGLVACAIAAVYPYLVHRSTILMSEVLAVPLLTALALVLFNMQTNFRRRQIFIAGALGALLMLCKANFQVVVFLVPLWGFFAFRNFKIAIARSVPVAAVMLLLVAPYAVRNALVEGRFVGLSTTSGITLYGAHNEIVFKDREFDGFWVNTVRLGEIGCITDGKISDADNSDRQFRLALESIRQNSDKMPMHLVYKLRNFWLIHTHYFLTGGASAVIPQITYMLLLPFFVIGLFASFRGPRRPVFFYLIFAALTLMTLVFYGNARMRAPIEPMIVILAAGGLVLAASTLWGKIEKKEKQDAPPIRRPLDAPDPRKMAYLTSQFPQTYETFILREVDALVDRGIAPTIFSLKTCRDKIVHPSAERHRERTVYSPFLFSAALISANARYLFTSPLKYFSALWNVASSCASNPWYLVKALAVFPKSAYFASLAEEKGIGHVHAHWSTIPADSAMVIARLAGVTWSVTAHAFDIYTTNPSLRRKLREAAFFVTCTAYNVNYLSQLVPRDRRVAVHLNYHGIDTAQYEFHPHAAAEPLRLLAVGRLTETKGFPHLIEAARILGGRGRGVALKIIGDGPMRVRLENLARSGGVAERVEFAGAMSHESVISEMKKADALVAPSVIARNGDRDGMPNVIAEAMALGLPVVASNLSGIPEFVHDGLTGLLVPPGDANGIADAVEKIANDGNLRMKIVRNARSLVEDEFDVETNVSALLRLFEGEVIGAGRAKEAGALHH